MQFYPVCKTSRWKDNNTTGKKVPKKALHYFSIVPSLQCLCKSNHTAKQMTWHATGKSTEKGKMQHPVDGKAWKNFDTRYLNFAAEPRNVRLGLTADGFNPFGNLSLSYIMWKDINDYLMPLIDDLKDLWELTCVRTIDAATDTTKARQDLKILGIRKELWLSQNKNRKCSKPHAKYSFTPDNRKSFVSSSKELNYQMGSYPTLSKK
nr:hypothetical protein [Tanacetum cinerariifolium]